MGETHVGFLRVQITEWRWWIFTYARYRMLNRRPTEGALTFWVLGFLGFSIGIHPPARMVNYIAKKKVLGGTEV